MFPDHQGITEHIYTRKQFPVTAVIGVFEYIILIILNDAVFIRNGTEFKFVISMTSSMFQGSKPLCLEI